jgi:hypothetical protein
VKRPYLTFLATTVLPAGLAMVAANQLARTSWRELARDSDARVARMVLTTFLARMDVPVDTLAPEPADAAEAAVLGVSRATGYATALYRGGRRWRSTRPPTGPDALDDAVLRDLPRHPEGLPLAGPGRRSGVLATLGPSTAGLAALAEPVRPPPPAVPRRLHLVMGLLLLFAILAGWIQLGRPQGCGSDGRRQSPASVASVVLLALVPLLSAVVFLSHLHTAYQDAVHQGTGQDLARGLSVAVSQDLLASTARVRSVTGFDATRTRDGVIEASTLSGNARALAALPAPPPSFTSSGPVATPDGPSLYTAWGMGGDTVMVLTTPIPVARIRAFDERAGAIAAVLALWMLLVLGVITRRRRQERA